MIQMQNGIQATLKDIFLNILCPFYGLALKNTKIAERTKENYFIKTNMGKKRHFWLCF